MSRGSSGGMSSTSGEYPRADSGHASGAEASRQASRWPECSVPLVDLTGKSAHVDQQFDRMLGKQGDEQISRVVERPTA